MLLLSSKLIYVAIRRREEHYDNDTDANWLWYFVSQYTPLYENGKQ